MSQIEHTKKWIKDVVIGLNFCPFAAKPFLENSILYVLADSYHPASIAEDLLHLLKRMEANPAVETAFFIMPEAFEDFDDLLDLHELLNEVLENEHYQGIYQLVAFHPDYIFENAELNDPANYTNRSPYPMFHIIREASITKVLELYPDAHLVPENNIKLSRQKGLDFMKTLLMKSLK